MRNTISKAIVAGLAASLVATTEPVSAQGPLPSYFPAQN